MSLKTSGLVQHGGSPGWLEESDPAGCDFCTDGRTACLFRTVPMALKGAAKLRTDGISSWCYKVNVQ